MEGIRMLVIMLMWRAFHPALALSGLSLPCCLVPDPSNESASGENGNCGWRMAPGSKPNSTTLHYILRTDLKGSMPHWIVNRAMGDMMFNFYHQLRVCVWGPLLRASVYLGQPP